MATNTKVTDNAGLLETGLYSDMIIECGGRSFKVHKAIVCVKSPVMAAQMNGPWKEAEASVLHVGEDFSAAIVERMLKHMYVGSYDEKIIESDADIPKHWPPVHKDLLLRAKMVAIADYYQVTELKAHAVHSFTIRASWSAPPAKVVLDIAEAIWALLPPDDRTLKNPISRLLDNHKHELCRDPSFMTALERGGGLVSEFVSLFVKANESEVRLQKDAQNRCTVLQAELERLKRVQRQQITTEVAKTSAAERNCRDLEATKLNQQSQIRTLNASVLELRDKLAKAEVSTKSNGPA